MSEVINCQSAETVLNCRVRMIVQKTDSPIVDSIGQNYDAIAER